MLLSKKIIITAAIVLVLSGLLGIFMVRFFYPKPLVGPDGTYPHIVNYCRIYDWKLQVIRNYPLNFCLFQKDGTFYGSNGAEVSKYDQNFQKVWTTFVDHNHHHLNITADGKKILVLSSEIRALKDKKVRFDLILMLDTKGKEIARWSSADVYSDMIKQANLSMPEPYWIKWDKDFVKRCQWELTHISSIFEIPKNPFAKINPAFQEGNFIVTDFGPLHSFFILSQDLKNVLWQSKKRYDAHDAQVLSDGRILFFRNSDRERGIHYSTIEEIDPETEAVLTMVKPDPSVHFFSTIRGTVQKLGPENYFASDETGGVGTLSLIHKSGRRVWSEANPDTEGQSHLPRPFGRVWAGDYTEFLKHSSQ